MKKAGIFLLCNPHKLSTGEHLPDRIVRIAELCMENDVVMVSDEIHSELLLGSQRFTPLGKLSREIARSSVTLVSASKTFNVPGLFCEFAVIPDPELRAKYMQVVEKLHVLVNKMGLLAAQVAFSGQCDEWLVELRRYLTANRDFLVEYVREHLHGIRMTIPWATYLAWLDCSALVKSGRIKGSPFEFFLKEAKVAFSDGMVFGPDHENFVRLNFGCPRDTQEQGLERVRKSLYC